MLFRTAIAILLLVYGTISFAEDTTKLENEVTLRVLEQLQPVSGGGYTIYQPKDNLAVVEKAETKKEENVSPNPAVKTYNSELNDALKWLGKVSPDDRPFILFFTTFTVPTTVKVRIPDAKDNTKLVSMSLREAMVPVLSFAIHSLSGGESFAKPIAITDTLYYIDIRNYDWTPEAIEKVSVADPYIREPWVDNRAVTALRIEAGNHFLRADWFVANTLDVLKQVDIDDKQTPLYYELLYAKAGIPKNLDEFRKVWGVDIDKIEKLRVSRGGVIDKGKSGVSRHNRSYYRARTEVGYYWQTQDVKNMQKGRDYIETIIPGLRDKDFDASETITNNRLGLQVYLLSNGQNNRIEFADNGVVTDHSNIDDKRVHTARSCIMCHAQGINIVGNSMRDILNQGMKLNFAEQDDAAQFKRFFLDADMDELVKEDQKIYATAIRKATGLSTEANATLFNDFMAWYEKDIDLEQAALECGLTLEEFKAKIPHTISGRLGSLLHGGVIPRENWEEVNTGKFAQAMLLILGLKNAGIEDKVKKPEPQAVRAIQPVAQRRLITTNRPVFLFRNRLDKNPVIVQAGVTFDALEVQDIEFKGNKERWVKVNKGWIPIVNDNVTFK